MAMKEETIANVAPANIVRMNLRIRGTAPYVQNKFSHKQAEKMKLAMSTPKAAKKGRAERAPRDYDEDFLRAQHIAPAGWNGIPCAAFRSAMIDACRTVGLVMTKAKMSVFVIADGFDAESGDALVKIIGAPERLESLVKNDNGAADIRIRPMWREWEAVVAVEFDADMITASSVVNLLDRAGRQVGVGEGRPFSRDSVGQGWGTFKVINEEE